MRMRIAAHDAQLAGVRVAAVLVELVPLDEFRRHEFVDEIQVVVNATNLEDFFAAKADAFVPVLLFTQVLGLFVFLAEFALVPPILDVAEKLDADLVRIKPARRHVNRAAVMIGVIDDLGSGDEMLAHQRAMPVTM